jgi:hypothetical protein
MSEPVFGIRCTVYRSPNTDHWLLRNGDTL